MTEMLKQSINYIIDFLLDGTFKRQDVFYGEISEAPTEAKVVIVPSDFFSEEVYAKPESLPGEKLEVLENNQKTPILFGSSKVEMSDGKIVLYADIIASSYFLMSRYEEIIKRDERDQFGRFLGKHALVFQNGYGMRPIVDEYGEYLRDLVQKADGKDELIHKSGFRKIYLTHDVDIPFRFDKISIALKQFIKNYIPNKEKLSHPLYSYFKWKEDPYYTFPQIITYDKKLKQSFPENVVESIYFLITGKSTKEYRYCNINMRKYKKMLKVLVNSGATLGLHVSHEAGINPKLIQQEVDDLPQEVKKELLKSRHHFLRWREPEHIDEMERFGIKEDFSLGYADMVGFRVGTCRPYRFINPVTGRLSEVIVHPMEIMECTLDRKAYMGLSFDEAIEVCEKIVEQVYKYNGELNVLFHNTSFVQADFDYNLLYERLLETITDIFLQDERRGC